MTSDFSRHLLGGMIVAILLVVFLTGTAMAGGTIQWIVAEEPPITYMQDGEYVGYGATMLRLLQDGLSQYTHEMSMAGNYKRVVQDVKEGPLTCAIGLFRTQEREKSMYFPEVPFFYFYNIQIAMKESLFYEMGKPQSLALREMLNQEEYILGLSTGRAYSDSLLEILNDFKEASNIFLRPQRGVSEGLFYMLLRGRIDYMFLYPDEATYLSDKADAKGVVVTVPITEALELSDAWCACTKNPEGKKATQAITRVLTTLRPDTAYRDPYKEWISPNLVEMYDKKFLDEFLTIRKK